MTVEDKPSPPDLSAGVFFASIPDGGLLAGTVGADPVLLTRNGDAVQALSAKCTHLGAPLDKGLVVDGAVRCPWHHACFSLETGEAVRAPAFDPLKVWAVVRRGDLIFVEHPRHTASSPVRRFEGHSQAGMVIIGGGAAGYACAHELRRLGHEGPVTLVSEDHAAPYDRTLLTKDYLDGSFGDDRLPIARTTLEDLGDTFLNGTTARSIETAGRLVHLANGHTLPYTKLLLATGAEPNRLAVPGAGLPHVHVLRSLEQCRGILAQAKTGAKVVVIGGSFIGLEAAASLRSRDLAVTVVTPEAEPLAKIVGPELARTILGVHTAKGTVFHTQSHVDAISADAVHLTNGTALPADLVVVGIGVTPRIALAENAGLRSKDGVVVDRFLQTNATDVYAAGDIARWPDPHTGDSIRVEHWVVAQRQGQVAARNMLGGTVPFDAVPFFWSKHFDLSFRYVGHARTWDTLTIDGDLDQRKATITYRKDGLDLAVVTVERDLEALLVEQHMEERTAC